MARKQLLSNKFQMMISDVELERIDEWMFSHKLKSRAEAIRQLVAMGLMTEELITLVQTSANYVEAISQNDTSKLDSKDLQKKSLQLQQKVVDIGLMLHDAELQIPSLDRLIGSVVHDILKRHGELERAEEKENQPAGKG